VRRLVALVVLMGLALVACTSAVTDTSTTTTSVETGPTTPPETTTTVPDPCPDVFCVVYTIRPDAVWSDGRPVTAEDFAFTLALFLDPQGPDPGNPGYTLVTGSEVIDDETFLIAMSVEFAAWRTLFENVYPAHAEYDPVMPGPTSGPFTLASWEEAITLERNVHYTAPDGGGDVESVRFEVADGVRAMVTGLSSGRFDVINPTPLDWVVEDVEGISGIQHSLIPGAYWEQISFNHSDPLLSLPWMREAIATALDRESVLNATVRALDPATTSLGNTVWMHGSSHYLDHFHVQHDPTGAVEILTGNGCVRGSDGIFVCDGIRASFIWATTVGDPDRSTQIDRGIEMLRGAGIEALPWRLSPSNLFSTPILYGDYRVWQMMSFAWKASADPFLGDSMYRCSGDGPHGMGLLNVARYCNDEVDQLIAVTSQIMDPLERADVYNQADQIYLEDVAVIPLYQRPSLLAWSSLLQGPLQNPWSTDTWNIGSWSGQSVVVFALAGEPASLTAPLPTDDAAALIMKALYLGAFSVTPDDEFVPALVSGAEVLVRGGG